MTSRQKQTRMKLKRTVELIGKRSEAIDSELDSFTKYISRIQHTIPSGVTQKINSYLATMKYHNRDLLY